MNRFKTDLANRQAQNLYRQRRVVTQARGSEVCVDHKAVLAFCSNDYLGLAQHPQVIAAFQAAAEQGVGAGASHLISGHHHEHNALEEELAAFVGAPRALLFSTGYMANLGVVTALMPRHSTLFEDKLNHASLIDAARLCQAQNRVALKRYAHGDVGKLESLLRAAAGEKLILSDGVFSMDGDLAPLPELMRLAAKYKAQLLIDDAHGLGVLGQSGAGLFNHFQLPLAGATPAPILMGTLGKALGTFGAFVAGSEEMVETLIQKARTYIYTTALPPAVAAATRVSLKLAASESWRRARLQSHVQFFRQGATSLGLSLMPSTTPIQPIVFGEPEQALAASEYLYAQGILAPAIRPPTVPAHASRLRVTFSAIHEQGQIERLLDALSHLPRI